MKTEEAEIYIDLSRVFLDSIDRQLNNTWGARRELNGLSSDSFSRLKFLVAFKEKYRFCTLN